MTTHDLVPGGAREDYQSRAQKWFVTTTDLVPRVES